MSRWGLSEGSLMGDSSEQALARGASTDSPSLFFHQPSFRRLWLPAGAITTSLDILTVASAVLPPSRGDGSFPCQELPEESAWNASRN